MPQKTLFVSFVYAHQIGSADSQSQYRLKVDDRSLLAGLRRATSVSRYRPFVTPVASQQSEAGFLEGGVLVTIHRLSQGGADRVAMVLANGLSAAGIPTSVLVMRTGGEAERALLDMLDPDVNVSHVGPAMGSRHLELLRGLRYVHRQIIHARPAIVLASSSNMGLVTALCARRCHGRGPKFVMKLTNPVIRPRDSGWLRHFYRRQLYGFIFKHYDRVLVLTDDERSTLCQMFPRLRERFETVANPYVTSAMLATSGRKPHSGGPRILALARMMPQKRLDRLLDAFARVTNKTVRLTILGDGPQRARLEQQAESLGIIDRVEMPGFVEDVLPWLRQTDLFVLSSDYEGLPAVVLEALACNVPVITTDCFEAARSLLRGASRCTVVPRDDVDAFAKAIDDNLALLDEPTTLRDIALPYGVEAATAAHVEVVRSLLPPIGYIE